MTITPPTPRSPSVVTTIALRPGWAADGYRLHPAALDATLHLSAAALPSAAHSAASAVTYVPAGLAALHAAPGPQPRGPVAQQYSATASPLPLTADGSASCDYALHGGAGTAGGGLRIGDLVSRPLARPSAAARDAAAAAAAGIRPMDTLYEVQNQAWRAAPTGADAATKAYVVRARRPRGDAGLAVRLTHVGRRNPPAVVVATALGLIQEQVLEGDASGFDLVTRAGASGDAVGGMRATSVGGPRRDASISAAALWGMLRAAATERPGVAWTGAAVSNALPLAIAGPKWGYNEKVGIRTWDPVVGLLPEHILETKHASTV
jgi:hypothetical protein